MTRNCSFKDRVKLFFIDYISFLTFYYLVFFTIFLIIFTTFLEIFNLPFELDLETNVFVLIMDCISWPIYSLFKDFLFKNGSFAKKVRKVKVIDAQTGEKPSKKKLILRNIFYITALTTGVNLVFCFKRLDNLSLGDLITKTRVVYIQDETDDGSVSPK